jgi:uncharacterized protein (DUF362 family)/NAD-dependent dihydropyrimidine dehydrogenase PreA subunit
MNNNSKIPVSIERCSSYDPQEVKAALNKVLAPLGGMKSFVTPGSRVLLKPNLLAPKSAEAAVCTHPEVVRAVALRVMDAGGTVFLGDSPAVGSVNVVLKRSGIADPVRELGIEVVSFRTPVSVSVPEGGIHRSILLAREALDFDVVINLPKLKTHGMMTITLAVKNMFGLVVGAAKSGWHLQANEHTRFADMLLDINRALPPVLNILDGIVAMEGNGPGSGDPRTVGLLAASSSALALDQVIAQVVGVGSERNPVIYRARERDLVGSEPEHVRVVGEPINEVRVHNFALPKSVSRVDFQLPGWMKRHLRKSLSSFPILDSQKCTTCGECVKICPTDAITLHDKSIGGGVVDKDKCISCFCCQEVCPEGAIEPAPGRLLRLLRLINAA